jgi:hypothetical protein
MMPPVFGGAVLGLALAVGLKFREMSSRWRSLVLGGAVGLLVGILFGWWWCAPRMIPEPPAPPVRQADGSLVLERVDPATQPRKAPHALPAGAVEERRASVVVQPPRGVLVQATADHLVQPHDMADHVADHGKVIDSCDCPPVQVDLSLVRMPDKTRRVVASSPTGQILSGVDIPIEPATLPRIPRWTLSAIAVGDLEGIRPGALLTRRFGPLVVGGGVLSDPGLRRPGAIVQAGITW